VWGCVALSIFGLFFNPKAMLSGLGRDPTLTGRTAIWHVVLSLHTNPLVGTGFESFWMGSRLLTVWDQTEKGIEEAHNGYLELYLNLGWVGISLLTAMIVTGYRSALITLRRSPHLGRIRLAFFTAGLIYSLTEAGFRMMSPIWIMFLLSVTDVPARGKPAAMKQFPPGKIAVPKGRPERPARLPVAAGQRIWSRSDSRQQLIQDAGMEASLSSRSRQSGVLRLPANPAAEMC